MAAMVMPQELLIAPTPMDLDGSAPAQVHERADVDSEVSGRYTTSKRELASQYADIYFYRLKKLKKHVKEAAARKFGSDVKLIDRILELEIGVKSVVFGTLYKDMKLKPNILDEINSDPTSGAANPPIEGLQGPGAFVSDTDTIVLEDESGRIILNLEAEGLPKAAQLVTGAVLAFLGTMHENGSLIVENVCTPGLAPQQKLDWDPDTAEKDSDALLLLVSGLSLGDPNSDPLATDLLVDYITGNLGGSADHAEAARIAQVIVAGASCFSVAEAAKATPAEGGGVGKAGAADRIRAQRRAEASPLQELDILLTRLCASVPVDVMAGPGDPCCMYLPQQPLLPCLLPSAKTYNTLRTTTNPYEVTLSVKTPAAAATAAAGKGKAAVSATPGVVVLGTSGQNVEDILKYSTLDGSLDILERLLEWRHLAPTAPDTLSCFPLKDEDPFVMEACPHVFFAGNQREYGASVMSGADSQRVLVVSVPSFATTNTAVLVNLRTLQARPIDFSCSSFD